MERRAAGRRRRTQARHSTTCNRRRRVTRYRVGAGDAVISVTEVRYDIRLYEAAAAYRGTQGDLKGWKDRVVLTAETNQHFDGHVAFDQARNKHVEYGRRPQQKAVGASNSA